MADITENEVRTFIAEKLAGDSEIEASEHRDVENKIMDYLVQEIKKVAKSKVLVLESFNVDRNFIMDTGLTEGFIIDSVVVMLVCKSSNNGFVPGDVVTSPTPYPQDSGRTASQGIGVQYNNADPSKIKLIINDQVTIMTAYNSGSGAAANNIVITASNWSLKLIVGYK